MMPSRPPTLRRWTRLMFLAWVFAASLAWADSIEVIALKQRSAEELMPIIRPLLSEHEAVSGTGYQLIIRAPADRMGQLKDLVAKLDGAVQQVTITVWRASRAEVEAEALGAQTRIAVSPDDVEVAARAHVSSTRTRAGDQDRYSVTTLEGTPAFVRSGVSIPVPGGYGYHGPPHAVGNVVSPGLWYKDVTSGFYALARVQGDSVTLQTSPQREALSSKGNGIVNTSGLVTTVRGRLGEWLELGGTSGSSNDHSSGILYSTRARESDKTSYWVKVELAP
jgi:hypothetical protein